MDEYFFANGNKWSDGLEAPDGFDLDEELMEGEEYDGEDEWSDRIELSWWAAGPS